MAVFVVVVAATKKQEAAGKTHFACRLAGGAQGGGNVPARLPSIPVGAGDAVAKPDVLVYAFVARSGVHIFANCRAGRKTGVALPGAEAIAQSKHVGIRAHARIPKQVPGAAYGLPVFKNHVAAVRAQGLEIVRCSNARESGANNHYVEEVGVDGGSGHACSLSDAKSAMYA